MIRFNLKSIFVFVTAVSLLIAVPLNRANLQRRIASLIHDRGGVVYFENETPSANPYNGKDIERKTTLLQNLQYSVSQIEFEFHNYDDRMKNSINNLAALQTIRLLGHDSEFGTKMLKDDFPRLNVVDVSADWRSTVSRFIR